MGKQRLVCIGAAKKRSHVEEIAFELRLIGCRIRCYETSEKLPHNIVDFSQVTDDEDVIHILKKVRNYGGSVSYITHRDLPPTMQLPSRVTKRGVKIFTNITVTSRRPHRKIGHEVPYPSFTTRGLIKAVEVPSCATDGREPVGCIEIGGIDKPFYE